MPTRKSVWDTVIKYIKDIVFIIMFVVAAGGWLASSISSKHDMKATIEANTTAIKSITGAVEKFNEYIIQQSELNGKIIMYMEQDQRNYNNNQNGN